MSADKIDIVWFDIGPFVRSADTACDTLAIGRYHMAGITVSAMAKYFGVDMCASFNGVIKRFQYQHSAPFTR